ncbi:Plasma membrane low glucose sensor [Scheffersomyces spartinae]|uniref:Plasma membrane low glucose sensor n=1 Tax=Scheffersomyces spartinae TaxID=45513 RepID=A0A9P7VCJ0_9ASCO|nr:Plasma membrane low glucose sensor [Scheffersomyces spartinae]KAG7195598.1 Plasma membrane low glucose sensor [Scheffersomyces spartinae]
MDSEKHLSSSTDTAPDPSNPPILHEDVNQHLDLNLPICQNENKDIMTTPPPMYSQQKNIEEQKHLSFLQRQWDKFLGGLEGLLYDNSNHDAQYYRKIKQKSSSTSAILVGMMAAVGGFLYGYDTGLINDILEMSYVKRHIATNGVRFSVHERALVTAILSLGTFCGALAAPPISDTYGRKSSIMVSSGIIFMIGNILQVSSQSITFLCIGRAILGVAVGLLSAIVPLYQAEASPKWVRGSIVFTYQWAITWGLLIASAICQGTRKLNNLGSYRIPVALQFLWGLTLCVGMYFLPESPRFYVTKNKLDLALESLSMLRRLPSDDPDLIEELVDIKANYDYEVSFGRTTILDCFRNGGGRHKQRLRMATGMGVQFFQQCSGINFIFYYGTNFFISAGMKNSYLMSFTTYCVNTVFTVPGILLIDIVGRRPLLLYGGVAMSCANFIIAVVGVAVLDTFISSTICISFLCVFIAIFASTWGGCTWALCSDIYGISIRQKAMSLSAATNWLVNFVLAYATPYLIDTGHHTAALGNKIFFIWGGFNAMGAVYVYFMVYETKGLKLEEVDFMYLNCSNARLSSKFKSRKIDYDQLDQPSLAIPNSRNSISYDHNDMNHLDVSSTSSFNNRDLESGPPSSSDSGSNSNTISPSSSPPPTSKDAQIICESATNGSTPPNNINNDTATSYYISQSVSNPNSANNATGNFKLNSTARDPSLMIIPYQNTGLPNDDSDEDDDGDDDDDENVTDYQSYLMSLQSSKVSNSQTLGLIDTPKYPIQSHHQSVFDEYEDLMNRQAIGHTVQLTSSSTSSNPGGLEKPTIIATPYFNAPPELDSLSEESSLEEEENRE